MDQWFRYLFGLLLLCGLISGFNCVVWKNCAGVATKGKVSAVVVVGCDKDPVCSMKKGQNATFSVKFVANENSSKLSAVVHGIVAGIPVPFPLDNPDGCKDCGITCPIKNNNEYTYTTNIFVKTSYPSIKLVVRWELKDGESNDVFCIELPVQIVDGAKRGRKL